METLLQEQTELSELDPSFNIEDELGKCAAELLEAGKAVAVAKKYYGGCSAKMIDMLKAAKRKAYVYNGQTISIKEIKADEKISVRT